MKIGVISDTHGVVSAWEKAMKVFEGADLILHAGDVLYHPPRIGCTAGYALPDLAELINACPVPIVIAKGNCDPEVYEELLNVPPLSPYAFVREGGMGILLRHGHNMSENELLMLTERHGANLLITGHTHLPLLERVGDIIHINPGSPAHPRYEHKGTLTPTVGIISDTEISIVDIITGDAIMSMPITI